MGRHPSPESRGPTPTPHTTACERVLRYWRLVGWGWGGRRLRVVGSDDHGTHWLITVAESSREDPSQDGMTVSMAVEQGTGFLYHYPSRPLRRIDDGDIESIRRGCKRITPADLDEWVAEVERNRSLGLICSGCDSPNLDCDGGQGFSVAGIDGEFVRWVHACHGCDWQSVKWVLEPRTASAWRCPFLRCTTVCRPG